jgi:hypothetical protein
MNKIRYKKGNSIIDTNEIQKMIQEYFQNLHSKIKKK